MKHFRSLLAVVLCVLGTMLGSPGFAQIELNRDYKQINPPQASSAKGVEVLEFFNYACPHCYEFEPLLKAWLRSKPKDVVFRYVPAIFNENMVPLAKLHYTLEEMGLLEKLQEKVYAAIHVQNQRLLDREAIVKWVVAQGVEEKKFTATFDSFSVDNKVKRSAQLTRSMKIPGTPYVVVGGRYLTGPSMVTKADGVDATRFVVVLNELVDMARSGGK
jgi:thiol:disulfide interchange protein DsbA